MLPCCVLAVLLQGRCKLHDDVCRDPVMMRCVFVVAAVLASAPLVLGQETTPTEPPPPAQVPQEAGKQAPAQPTLKVGDKAPALLIEKWVKGEPVAAYEPGRIY